MTASKSTAVRAAVEGDELVVRVPVEKPPRLSATGKSVIYASTRGNVLTAIEVEGRQLYVGMTAFALAK